MLRRAPLAIGARGASHGMASAQRSNPEAVASRAAVQVLAPRWLPPVAAADWAQLGTAACHARKSVKRAQPEQGMRQAERAMSSLAQAPHTRKSIQVHRSSTRPERGKRVRRTVLFTQRPARTGAVVIDHARQKGTTMKLGRRCNDDHDMRQRSTRRARPTVGKRPKRE